MTNLVLKELKKEGVTYYIYSINDVLISMNIILDNKMHKSNIDHVCRLFQSELLYKMFDKTLKVTIDQLKQIIANFFKSYNKNTTLKKIPYEVDNFHAFELARTKIEEEEYQVIKFYLKTLVPYDAEKDKLYYIKKKSEIDKKIVPVSDQYYLKATIKPEIFNRNLYYLSPRWEFGLNDFVMKLGRVGTRENSCLFDIYQLNLNPEIKSIYINSTFYPYIDRNNKLHIYSVFVDDTLEYLHDSICSINNDIVLRLTKNE